MPGSETNGSDSSHGSVVLSGAPAALEGVVPVPSLQRKSIRLEFGDDQVQIDARVLTAPLGAGSTLVRVVAADTTAPGRYQAQLVAEDSRIPVTVEVGAEPLLLLTPSALAFRCDPGGRDQVALVMGNVGNVAFAPQREYGVGLLEDGAIEAAIGVSLRMTRQHDHSRVERFGDALSERYGGLGLLKIVGGPPTVEPGAVVGATAEIRLTSEAKPGRMYHGLWEPEGAKVTVTVETPPAAPGPGASRRSRKVSDEPASQ